MHALVPLFLLSCINICRSDCVIDNRSLSQEWEKKLHGDFKCNYRFNESPNKNNVTEVKLWISMKYFELDSEDLFSMYSWLTMHWTDKRLSWDPSKYGGITTTTILSHNIWTPLLTLNNRHDDETAAYFHTECRIESSGSVICVPRLLDTVECSTNIMSWPYDTTRCTLEYGILSPQKNVYINSKLVKAVTLNGAEYGSEWTIVDYKQVNNVSDSAQLKITFVLARNGESIGAAIICPFIVLSLLTVSSILLDVADKNRLLMMIFGVMCHCMYLTEIGWEVPKHSDATPSILLFYRFSIIFNMYLVVLTVLLLKLRNKESSPPNWVSNISKTVSGSHGKYFLWPRWETKRHLLTSKTVNVEDVDKWNVLANTINSVFFFVAVLIYSVMIPVFIPRRGHKV